MLNEEQNSTVLTEIQTEENHVSPEVEENTEKISTEKTDIVVEENVEENINSENSSAPEDLSSSFSKTDNLTEKEELEIEVENTILPNIYNGIISEDYADKLIRLGDLYAENSRNKESAMYLRYYHFMAARFVLEKIYEKSQDEADLYKLENFESKYERAKEEYNKVRDNSLPLEVRLIRDYIDSVVDVVVTIKKDSDDTTTMTISHKSESAEESNLFLLPESDFYGILDRIEFKIKKPLQLKFKHNQITKNFIDGVEFRKGFIIFTSNENEKKIGILALDSKNTIITIYGNVSYYITTYFKSDFQNTYLKQTKINDIFESWDTFKKYVELDLISNETNWFLVYLFYLQMKYNDSEIHVARMKLLYTESGRMTKSRMVRFHSILQACKNYGRIIYNFPCMALTEKGRQLVIREYLKLSEEALERYRLYHKLLLSNKSVKLLNHPTYREWKKFIEIVDTTKNINIIEWYLIYLYFLIQKYSTKNILGVELATIFRDDKRFNRKNNGDTNIKLKTYLNRNWYNYDNGEYSLTETGKEHILGFFKANIPIEETEIQETRNFTELRNSVSFITISNDDNIFEHWSIFEKYIKVDRLLRHTDWVLLYIFYLNYKYDDNYIFKYKIKMICQEAKRYISHKNPNIRKSIEILLRKNYIEKHDSYISITKLGQQSVFDNFLNVSKHDFLVCAEKRKAEILSTSVKIFNHPRCKTWEEFMNMVYTQTKITNITWHLLYSYYIMQKYNTKTITNVDVASINAVDDRFYWRATGSTGQHLQACLCHKWITLNAHEFSLTDIGKRCVRSLLK